MKNHEKLPFSSYFGSKIFGTTVFFYFRQVGMVKKHHTTVPLTCKISILNISGERPCYAPEYCAAEKIREKFLRDKICEPVYSSVPEGQSRQAYSVLIIT
jgi:hypothetical protein